jgi:hypothetical protein
MEPASVLWNRIGFVGVLFLLVAFVLGFMGPTLTSAGADELVGKRDDGVHELVAGGDDEDDDDGDGATEGTGEPSIGSNSGNTATGTTKGTGKSHSVSDTSEQSKNTKTGTTKGTGPSHSVSNSS